MTPTWHGFSACARALDDRRPRTPSQPDRCGVLPFDAGLFSVDGNGDHVTIAHTREVETVTALTQKTGTLGLPPKGGTNGRYRLYYLGADGKIFAADAIQADSDEAAISIAQMKAASTQLD